MDIGQNLFERFEAYWSGVLPESDRQQLEIDLLVDPHLQQAFSEYKRAREGLDLLARTDMKNQLDALDRNLDGSVQTQHPGRSPKRKALLLVSALTAFLVLGWLFYPRGYSINNLPHEEGVPLYMGEQETRAFDSAMSVYRSVDFSEAVRAFSGLPDMEQNDTILFYLANAELRSGNSAIALKHFRLLTEQKTSVFYDKARFYTAMALWSAGNEHEASALLRQIASEREHPYHEQAQAAIEQME